MDNEYETWEQKGKGKTDGVWANDLDVFGYECITTKELLDPCKPNMESGT